MSQANLTRERMSQEEIRALSMRAPPHTCGDETLPPDAGMEEMGSGVTVKVNADG